MYELIAGICAAGALMLIEHLTARGLHFLMRYCLGMLAFLAGFGLWAWLAQDIAALQAAVVIAFGGGALVLIAYGLRWMWEREIRRAREAGRIQGRVEESNKNATAGIIRTRKD